MTENTKAIWAIGKALVFVVFLPFALIWFVWNKADWKKQNKWIATAGIAVVFLFIFFSSGKKEAGKKEAESSAAKIAELQKQLEAEKQIGELKRQIEEEKNKNSEVKEEIFKVTHVIDGDTIKLSNGGVVRFIGIDAPETVDPEKPAECFGKESGEKNKELLEGKEIKLVKDVSEKDKYGRILRYVYAGDIFVNDYLVRNGFAKASNFPPDEKFKDQFKEAQEEAKTNKRGMWADGVCLTPAPTAKSAATIIPAPVPVSKIITPVPASSSAGGSYACNCSKTCPQMSSCAEAQYQLNSCGCSARDADHDGIACDADCQ